MSGQYVRLERRALGATGLSVSVIGMGCARLSAFWQGRSPFQGVGAVREALHRGIDFFDTADCYARGLSERILGLALRGRRQDVIISTKVGLLKTPLAIASAARRSALGDGRGGSLRRAGSLLAAAKGMAPGADALSCFTPAYVERAVERSLGRLGTDYVDILLLHEPPPDVLLAQVFLPALGRLQRSGMIRHFGVSCSSAEAARAALDLPGIACVQVRHNVASADVVPAILPQATRSGAGVIAVAPFGDASLIEAAHPAGDGEPSRSVDRCLRFCLSTPGVSSVLVGMSRREHVIANATAVAYRTDGRPGADRR